MNRPRHIAGGISLIEAVVALAVIAFGMLAYVGLQSSLRFNSDVAKQRSEAVRIAQQVIEEGRAYAFIETAAASAAGVGRAYDDLSTGQSSSVIAGDNGNFTLQRTVVDAAATTDPLLLGAAPRMKTLSVDVSWQDRRGETQSVRLSTTVIASPPELAGTLAVPAVSGGAQERHPAIPVKAKNLNNGTSGYKPPGAAGATTVFVFDNATGVIVGLCNGISKRQSWLTAADVQSCSNNANGLPLSGFVRFFTGSLQPTATDAENPSGYALNLDINLALTSTGHPNPAYACYADAPSSSLTTNIAVPYFCAIFFQTGVTNPNWSGTSTLLPLPFTLPQPSPLPVWQLADDTAGRDKRSDRYRVCRYTPATSDTQLIPNELHPRNYVNVAAGEALANQNFLVIPAGNDDGVIQNPVAFTCPTDVPANPAASDFVNSNTLEHQP